IKIALNGEWNQRAQLLAEQQSLGEYILAKLEKVKSDRSKTYCVSILAVLGMLSVVLERARTAHREGKEYGGNFMIYGETEFRQEEQENMIRMRDELVSQYNRHNQVILDKIEQQQSDQTEVEKLGHDIADFKGIISRTGAVIQTIKAGGIAVVNANQDVPKDISYNEMINMKGILLALPEFALYMNGKLLWKRDQTQPIQQPQQQSSQSSTSQILPQTKQELKPFPVWAHLCLQLNMESDQRIAKFFIGPDLGELVGVGVSGLPDEIKVVVLSSGALKAFQAFNTQRVGDAITSLVQ
ncbi:MAG: hypothetical protein EZS28_037281, partial [Streblomastix strix]